MSLVYLVDAPSRFLLPIAVFLGSRSLCGGTCLFEPWVFILGRSELVSIR